MRSPVRGLKAATALAALAALVLLSAAGQPEPPAAPVPAAMQTPETQAPPAAGDYAEAVALSDDASSRMSIPVSLGGRGPYAFTVDTGADHSVISRELAATLNLETLGQARVHGVSGSELVPLMAAGQMGVGGRKLDGLKLAALNGSDLGASGMVGLDCLAGQRVVLDFIKKTMTVERSRGFHFDPDAIVVHAKPRFGQLVLVDSTLKRQPIYVIVDSGAQNTIANSALRRLVEARRAKDGALAVTILSVTGQTALGQRDEMPELTLGRVTLRRVPVIYSDLHTFARFGLADQPAMLLGVDTLRAFDRVSIDFGRREVSFGLPVRTDPAPPRGLTWGG